jgi:hypothetical protein
MIFFFFFFVCALDVALSFDKKTIVVNNWCTESNSLNVMFFDTRNIGNLRIWRVQFASRTSLWA